MNKTLTLAFAATLGGCAHDQTTKPAAPVAATSTAVAATPLVTPDADFRQTKPAPSSGAVTFAAPVPVERTLSNGAKLLVVENHAVPLVAIDVLIETGVDGEPMGKAGLAGFVAGMLSEGTKTRPATKLAEELEDIAAQFMAAPGKEHTQLVLNSLSDTLPKAVGLLADMIVNPAFNKDDVERQRGLLLTQLEQKNSSPQLIALDEVSRVLYGEKHPWGQPNGGTAATLKSISIADLQKFHDSYYRPSNAIISVSGDVNADDVQKLLDGALKGWKKRTRVAVKLPKVKAPARTVLFVDKPGASQSQVFTFGPAVSAKDPDAVPLRVANYIIGGPFARLDLNIREDKGYSYGVRTNPVFMKDSGYWVAAGGVKANVTAEALGEFEKELTTFSDGKLRGNELVNAQQAMVRSLPTVLERNNSVAMAMAALAFNGQPLDYYKTLPDHIAKIDAAEVARIAAKYDKPAQWSIVLVGPRAASEEKLKAMNLGPITWKDVAPAVAKEEKAAKKLEKAKQ